MNQTEQKKKQTSVFDTYSFTVCDDTCSEDRKQETMRKINTTIIKDAQLRIALLQAWMLFSLRLNPQCLEVISAQTTNRSKDVFSTLKSHFKWKLVFELIVLHRLQKVIKNRSSTKSHEKLSLMGNLNEVVKERKLQKLFIHM